MPEIVNDPASGLDYIAVGKTENPKHILVLVPNGPVPLSQLIPPGQLEMAKSMNPGVDFDKARNWARPPENAPAQEEMDEETMARISSETYAFPVKAVNALIDGKLEEHGLTDGDLAIYGFSAGGSMALYTAMARPEPCAGIVSHSGHFTGAAEILSTPDTLMMTGDQEIANPMIKELFQASAGWLRELGFRVEEHVCKDLGHDINEEAFEKATGFMKQALGMEGAVPVSQPCAPETPRL